MNPGPCLWRRGDLPSSLPTAYGSRRDWIGPTGGTGAAPRRYPAGPRAGILDWMGRPDRDQAGAGRGMHPRLRLSFRPIPVLAPPVGPNWPDDREDVAGT